MARSDRLANLAVPADWATGTTASTPVTAGSTPSAVSEGMATTPSGDLPGPHRTTQPMDPDGTPSPIGSEGQLTAEGDDPLRGDR